MLTTLSALESVLNYLKFSTTQGAAMQAAWDHYCSESGAMNQSTRQQAEMMAAAERVMARADELAAISETAEGLTRVYLSPQHLQANQQVARWMTQAGMTVWQDSVREHLRAL
ncbi:N-carbamoyl-L-amino acid hydrolase [Raoultella ornithinolytica]|nr:N-carbamoyl-L-amino acid hydrolase [Raoultella ornithinolytica]